MITSAYSAPKRISSKKVVEKKTEIKIKKLELKSDEEIEKMKLDEVKDYLKTITEILKLMN